MALIFGSSLLKTHIVTDSFVTRYSFYAIMLIFGISIIIYFRKELNMRAVLLQMISVTAVIFIVFLMVNFSLI